MFGKITDKKELFRYSLSFTVLFYLLAHGYRFTVSMFSGDSLLMIHQNDSAWEIALGRFMHPFLVLLRGGVESPFLICLISMLFLGLSVYFTADFLEITRKISVIAMAAVMTCNVTVLANNATFLSYADFYMIALFLSVFGVWLMKRGSFLYTAAGVLALSFSMGIYQSYISVSISLILIRLLFRMYEKPTFREVVLQAVKYAAVLAVSAAVYFVLWKIFQKAFHIWTADTYNGMASLGEYGLASLGENIVQAYRNVFRYFLEPDTFVTIPFRGMSLSILWKWLLRLCNVLTLVLLTAGWLYRGLIIRIKLWHWALQGVILLFLPLGMNFVCVISGGMEHTLMIYGFYTLYVLAVKMTEDCSISFTKIKKENLHWVLPVAVLACLAVTVWSNIVYSNQVYLKKDLQDKAILSMMTRIVYEIETMEDYVPGVTPVAFYGSFEDSSYVKEQEIFRELKPYGMGKSPLTYAGTDYAYLNNVMNVNMNLTREFGDGEAVAAMPSYPVRGSVKMVDGTVFVKISEVKPAE